MADASYTSNEQLQNARTVLSCLQDLLATPRAVTYMTHRGISEPAELGKAACGIGIALSNSHSTDIQGAISREVEPIADTLRFLKSRFAIQLEPSMLGKSSAAEKIEAEKMIKKIDSIASAASIEILVSKGNSSKGNYSSAGYRDR